MEIVEDDVVHLRSSIEDFLQILVVRTIMSGQVVFLLPRVCVRDVTAVMCRHEIETAVNLHRVGVIQDDNAFSHMLARHAVMVLEEGYMAVLAYGHQLSLLDDERFLGERTQKVLLPLQEHVFARHLPSGHQLLVEVMQRYVDCRVQFVKRWEDHTLYVKIHRLVQQLDGVFDKGLVLGMTYPGRIYGASVIFGEGRELLVDHRLVAVACLYSRRDRPPPCQDLGLQNYKKIPLPMLRLGSFLFYPNGVNLILPKGVNHARLFHTSQNEIQFN